MRKKSLIFVVLLALAWTVPQRAFANMAAPENADVGSAITFEKNDKIAVLSEDLEIVVKGPDARITATYEMKNTTDEALSVSSMFLSPNMEEKGGTVTVNGKQADVSVQRYGMNGSTQIITDDWRYAVLTTEEIASLDPDRTVDTVTFQMDFQPQETYPVVVSYDCNLGGYPELDFNAKRGELEYYLAPAAMWKDFSNLTIRLYLDKDMPVLVESSLPFERVAEREYVYTSDTLPEGNLQISIDENGWQNFISTLKSPYFQMTLRFFAPIIILVVVVVILIHVWRKRRKS